MRGFTLGLLRLAPWRLVMVMMLRIRPAIFISYHSYDIALKASVVFGRMNVALPLHSLRYTFSSSNK